MSSTTSLLPADAEPLDQRVVEKPLRVVLCGSFRREPKILAAVFDLLQATYEVLSPIDVHFVDSQADFVRLPHELQESATDIEQRHLNALTEADFVWLYAPDGYVGASAMFELGHAKALGIPIFSDTEPAEDTYKPWITVVSGPGAVVLEQSVKAPGNGIRGLQHYYDRAAARRGWAGESMQDTMLLMTEEMGELARAVRKSAGLARDGDWQGQDLAEELADVQLYLVHLANAAGIDLADAVTAKEVINQQRVDERSAVA